MSGVGQRLTVLANLIFFLSWAHCLKWGRSEAAAEGLVGPVFLSKILIDQLSRNICHHQRSFLFTSFLFFHAYVSSELKNFFHFFVRRLEMDDLWLGDSGAREMSVFTGQFSFSPNCSSTSFPHRKWILGHIVFKKIDGILLACLLRGSCLFTLSHMLELGSKLIFLVGCPDRALKVAVILHSVGKSTQWTVFFFSLMNIPSGGLTLIVGTQK